MTDSKLKRRMSPMDAFFLYSDSEESPMTIGFVGLFEGKVPIRTFRSRINSRLHLIPRYRQVVVQTPFNLAMPTWEDDPAFDISNHVQQVRLGKRVSESELIQYAEGCFEGRMDTSRPLWEIVLVPNVEGNRTGVICRVHHCMVDGVGGVGLMQVVFDVVPDPKPIRKRRYKPAPMPDKSLLLYDAIWDNALEGIGHWTGFGAKFKTFTSGKSRENLIASLGEFAKQVSDLLSPSKRLPFNKPFNGARKFAFADLSFAEARAIKSAVGGTINDVALTTLAGAMSDYLERRGHNTLGEELAVICPVNIREKHDDSVGNQISFLPVKVPLDVDDPLERFSLVRYRTKELKNAGVPEMVHLLFTALQGLPAPMQKAFLTGLSASPYRNVIERLPQIPPGNLICTNVPGPQIPLYSCGQRLEKYYPILPLALEMGISCGITSYAQTLYFSFIGDGGCAPDIDVFRDSFRKSFEQLRGAASVDQKEHVPLHYMPTRMPEGKIVPMDRSNVIPLERSRDVVGSSS